MSWQRTVYRHSSVANDNAVHIMLWQMKISYQNAAANGNMYSNAVENDKILPNARQTVVLVEITICVNE